MSEIETFELDIPYGMAGKKTITVVKLSEHAKRVQELEEQVRELREVLSPIVIEKVFDWLIDYPNDERDEELAQMVKEFRNFVWNTRAALKESLK